jgi:hypothetical protein
MGSQLLGSIVHTYPPVAPPGATAVNIYADTPLELSNANSPNDTDYIIPNGKTFYMQRAIIGAGKDPSEKGTMVEVIYKASSVEHVIARYFVDQKTFEIQVVDLGKSRDGTDMVGDGSSKKIIVRRTRLSSATQPVDVHIQGYVE